MLARFSLVLLLWFCVSSWGQEVDYNRSEGLCSHGNRLMCCWGWRPTESGRCQPHCEQGCKHGVCVGPDQCKCHPGYTGKACNQDLNECGLKPRPCKHRCMNTLGSFKCFCQDGYTETQEGRCRNARTCFHANCQYGCEVMKGAVRCTCPSPGLRLSPDRRTCSGNPKCVNTFGSFLCKCHLGFRLTYINGRYSCIDKDPRPFCSLNPSSPKCRCSDGSCRAVLKVTLEPHRPRTTTTTTARTTTPTTTAATTYPLTTTTSPTPVQTTTPITTTMASTTIKTTNPTTVLTTTPITPSAPTTIPPTTARTTTPITPSAPTTIPPTTARTTTPITPSAPTTIPPTTARTTTPITPSAPTTILPTTATTPITPSAPTTILPTTARTTTPITPSAPTTILPTTARTTTPITPSAPTTIPPTTARTTTPIPARTPTPITPSAAQPTETIATTTPDTFTTTTTSTKEPSTTTVNNRINKDVTHRQRGDVHIPRHPNPNQELEFDIELGNIAEDNRDDPEVGVLRCPSDQGVCDWMSDRDGDLHWETAENPAGGRYLSVSELKAGQRSIRGARLAVPIVPPWSHGDLCFSFSHWLTGHHVGVLQLFIRKKGRDQRFSSALWTRTGGHGWRHTQVTLTTHSLDKAERRKGRRGQIAVDDVTLRRGAC
ncbi:hypothetical protein JOQ06_013549 [Pogonophryne albipinna]|uniref:Nephronectin n=1 Tax=Pogonophryne albipinna TaxID=1090488 RepID=A0AAD6BJ61_9TELE|nr:hypothetical protein JOQ06_013549 [Pogonophryne albipinna]